MSTISELRTEAQTKGQELVKRFQELENAEKQILMILMTQYQRRNA